MVDYLAERAKYLHLIRNYFADQNVLEVFTDSLLIYPVSDPFIDSASLILNKNISKEQNFFLHTSPEIEMKKLLFFRNIFIQNDISTIDKWITNWIT